jgi:outer membrane protein
MKARTSLAALLLVTSTAAAQEPATAPDPGAEVGQTTTRVLSLEAALTQAARLNPSLHAATADADAADARADQARAALLPQLTGTASYQRTTGNFVPRPGQLPRAVVDTASGAANRRDPWQLFNFYNFGATASVLLYDFQGSIDRLRGAKESSRAAEQRARAAVLAVELAVRDAFFRARAQRELVEVAREALANTERHVEQIAAFVEVGTRPEIDVRQARTDVANARVQLVQAQNGHALAKAELARAIGLEAQVDFEVAEEQLGAVNEEDAPIEQLLERALVARPDVLAVERELRASERGETAARGAYGPALTASTTITEAGRELDDLQFNWNAGVQLTWPIVRGGATIAEVREARANARRAQANLGELRQTVRLQVEQARLGIAAARAVIEAAAEARDNARARLELAEGRYEAGVGNVIELGDARVALTQAEAQSVSAEYSLSMARAQLLSALGRSR